MIIIEYIIYYGRQLHLVSLASGRHDVEDTTNVGLLQVAVKETLLVKVNPYQGVPLFVNVEVKWHLNLYHFLFIFSCNMVNKIYFSIVAHYVCIICY